MNTNADIKNTLTTRKMGTDSATLISLENTVKNDQTINPELRNHHGIDGIIKTTENQKNAIVIGTRSVATGDNAMALGRGAFAMANNAFGIGSYSYADHVNAMAIGATSRALAENSITVGAGSVVTEGSKNASVLGTNSGVAGANSTVVGANSQVLGSNSLLFGNNTYIIKEPGVVGATSDTDWVRKINEGKKNSEIGKEGVVTNSNNNIAIGNNILVAAGVTNSMAYGAGASIGDADKTDNKIKNSTVFGMGARVKREYDGTVNPDSNASDIEDEAKNNAKFMHTGNNAMAIGNNSRATLENSVALGVKSSTDYSYYDLMQPGWTARGSIAIPTSGQTGVISVGAKGGERRVVNVASGYRDTDAVNVIQLRTLEETVTRKVDNIESGMHYLSVNKKGPTNVATEPGSAKVTELIERSKNYDKYITYKIQYLQLLARQNWQGEKFNQQSVDEIRTLVENLESDPVISEVAKDLKNQQVAPTPPGGKTGAVAYSDFVTTLENLRTKLTKKVRDTGKENSTLEADKTPYERLLGGVDIKELEKETNYSNEGAKGIDSLAIGFRTKTTDDAKNAFAAGYKTTASKEYAIAIGPETKASGSSSIAIGREAEATQNLSIAIGSKDGSRNTLVSKEGSVGIGNGTQISGSWSTGIGGNVTVTGNTSVAIGDRAEAKANNAVALGAAAKANIANSVALGQGTEAKATSGNSYLTNRSLSNTGKVVAVGNRRIIQVEDGAKDDDAVTVRQLQNAYIKVKGQNKGSATTNDLNVKTTESINITGGNFNSDSNGPRYVGDNISTFIGKDATTNEATLTIGIKEVPKFKGLILNNGANNTTKDLNLSVDNDGNLNLATSNTGNTKAKITNVANGTGDNDAVNYSQLKGSVLKIIAENSDRIQDNTVTTNLGGNVKFQTGVFNAGGVRYQGTNLATFIGKADGTNDPIVTIGMNPNPTFNTLKLNNGASGSQTLTLLET